MVICKQFRFEASHNLPKHKTKDGKPGKCSRLHGHSYLIDVAVQGPVNPDTGMVLDFADLDDIVKDEIISLFDHRHINEILIAMSWPGEATAENLAYYAWAVISKRLEGSGCALYRIRIHETANCYVETYSGKPVAEVPQGEANG